MTEQNKKPDLKFYIIVITMAFILGGIMRLGGKTVDHIWPDAPIQVEVSGK